jgi:hypothetical protein
MKPCGCRNVESCHRCVPSAGLWLTLGVVGTLAAFSVAARRGGSGNEHPWYAFARWQSSDHTDKEAARTLSQIMGWDVASRYAESYTDPSFWDGEIEETILNRYGPPEV